MDAARVRERELDATGVSKTMGSSESSPETSTGCDPALLMTRASRVLGVVLVEGGANGRTRVANIQSRVNIAAISEARGTE